MWSYEFDLSSPVPLLYNLLVNRNSASTGRGISLTAYYCCNQNQPISVQYWIPRSQSYVIHEPNHRRACWSRIHRFSNRPSLCMMSSNMKGSNCKVMNSTVVRPRYFILKNYRNSLPVSYNLLENRNSASTGQGISLTAYCSHWNQPMSVQYWIPRCQSYVIHEPSHHRACWIRISRFRNTPSLYMMTLISHFLRYTTITRIRDTRSSSK